MTREKEIMKEAEKVASANTQIIGDWGEHYLGFIHGAEWADRTMIAKACDLLRDLDVFTEDFINDFRKAMKGEK